MSYERALYRLYLKAKILSIFTFSQGIFYIIKETGLAFIRKKQALGDRKATEKRKFAKFLAKTHNEKLLFFKFSILDS